MIRKHKKKIILSKKKIEFWPTYVWAAIPNRGSGVDYIVTRTRLQAIFCCKT